MQPIAICKDRGFLISPLDIPVYILELPATPSGSLLKEPFLEGEILHQLKALYPGTPDTTLVDYKIYRSKNRNKVQTAAVFVSSRPRHAVYLNLKRPLIPGVTIMSAGMCRMQRRCAGNFGANGLAILCTPQWIEAAFLRTA
ncbi:hypothetical protein AGMMS49940_06980 [Spirochaetia bacterium]|nr:hypothetical protein AGMMS49940_06980 [Spirochaetia bacterium]